jgi:hypothetical protein
VSFTFIIRSHGKQLTRFLLGSCVFTAAGNVLVYVRHAKRMSSCRQEYVAYWVRWFSPLPSEQIAECKPISVQINEAFLRSVNVAIRLLCRLTDVLQSNILPRKCLPWPTKNLGNLEIWDSYSREEVPLFCDVSQCRMTLPRLSWRWMQLSAPKHRCMYTNLYFVIFLKTVITLGHIA